ncbi:MAG: pantetheine-phosphate adenylyltransferase [Malacoplasma sp.]|nr:pantetheine-phosphate adenylyltransferase [Malacoplasma sp.]
MQNTKKCIFPGTFKIFHNGHINILKRAKSLFDTVYVVVANNDTKQYIDINTRFENVKKVVDELKLDNVIVAKWDAYLVEFAKQHSIYFIVRGIRDTTDFKYEKAIERIYKQQWNQIEVVYLFADKELEDLSATKILSKK